MSSEYSMGLRPPSCRGAASVPSVRALRRVEGYGKPYPYRTFIAIGGPRTRVTLSMTVPFFISFISPLD